MTTKITMALNSTLVVITPRGLIRDAGYEPLIVEFIQSNRVNVWAEMVVFLEKCSCPASLTFAQDIRKLIRVIRTTPPDTVEFDFQSNELATCIIIDDAS